MTRKEIKQERNIILDASSDIVVFGMILGIIQVIVYRSFGFGQATVAILFLGAASVWKLVSPFTETYTSWKRYLSAVILVLGGLGLVLLTIWFS